MNIEYKNPKIIVIAGKARTGKNTVANILNTLYKEKYKKVIICPYTKYLKEYIKEITNIDYTDDNKPRELLQQLGVEIIKEKLGKKDMFITRVLDDIDIYSYYFDVIIIPDARFPKEIDILKEKYNNVVSIKVISNKKTNITQKEMEHITETALDNYSDSNFDYIIDNDNYNLLENKVKDIYDNIENS